MSFFVCGTQNPAMITNDDSGITCTALSIKIACSKFHYTVQSKDSRCMHIDSFLGILEHRSTTVDGRNPAPVEVGSLSHYLYIPGGELDF